jgi:hypothetical protein
MDEQKPKVAQTDSGAMGGKSRAANMTKEQRSESARLAALARWTGGEVPRVSHKGALKIGDLEIPCYVLDEPGIPRRVLSAAAMVSTLGMSRGSNPKIGGDRLSNFVAGKLISPFVSEELRGVIQSPIVFQLSGQVAYGYEARVLAMLCKAVLRLQRSGGLQAQQEPIARQCEILQDGFSEVGIVALVDEATGYQANRARDALAKILEKFIAKELRPWTKTFQPDFYKEMYRLKGWKLSETGGNARPGVVGRYTNDLVYDRLAPGALEALKESTPRDDKGRLKSHLHRRLTEDVGHPKLREHLAVVTAFMRASTNWSGFQLALDKACPRMGRNYELALDDE